MRYGDTVCVICDGVLKPWSAVDAERGPAHRVCYEAPPHLQDWLMVARHGDALEEPCPVDAIVSWLMAGGEMSGSAQLRLAIEIIDLRRKLEAKNGDS